MDENTEDNPAEHRYWLRAPDDRGNAEEIELTPEEAFDLRQKLEAGKPGIITRVLPEDEDAELVAEEDGTLTRRVPLEDDDSPDRPDGGANLQ